MQTYLSNADSVTLLENIMRDIIFFDSMDLSV